MYIMHCTRTPFDIYLKFHIHIMIIDRMGNILFRINVLSQFQSIISSVFPQFVVLGTSTFVILVYLSAIIP